MACVLKERTSTDKGVIVLTSNDIKLAVKIENENLIQNLRKSYIIGLHYNWFPVDVKPPAFVDFIFCPSHELKAETHKEQKVFEYTAQNFVPTIFEKKGNEERSWDFIILARDVEFKNNYFALDTIRAYIDTFNVIPKVLFLMPKPKLSIVEKLRNFIFKLINPGIHSLYSKSHIKTITHGVSKYFEHTFTQEERKRIKLIDSYTNYPFMFEREDLSLFLKHSKVYLHFSKSESRGRNISYALVAGAIVVGFEQLEDSIPMELTLGGYFFKALNDLDFIHLMEKALSNIRGEPVQDSAFNHFRELVNVPRLINFCMENFKLSNENWNTSNLDIRIAWNLQSRDINGLDTTFESFIKKILNRNIDSGYLYSYLNSGYPEEL